MNKDIINIIKKSKNYKKNQSNVLKEIIKYIITDNIFDNSDIMYIKITKHFKNKIK